MSVAEDTDKLETSYTTGRNVKWYSCFGKISQIPENVKQLLYGTTILPLGMYPNNLTLTVRTKYCPWIFIAVLFIIAPKWKRTNIHHLLNRQAKCGIYPYNGISLGNEKGHTNSCYSMDEPWKYHAKLKKPDRNGHTLIWNGSRHMKCPK